MYVWVHGIFTLDDCCSCCCSCTSKYWSIVLKLSSCFFLLLPLLLLLTSLRGGTLSVCPGPRCSSSLLVDSCVGALCLCVRFANSSLSCRSFCSSISTMVGMLSSSTRLVTGERSGRLSPSDFLLLELSNEWPALWFVLRHVRASQCIGGLYVPSLYRDCTLNLRMDHHYSPKSIIK